MAEAEARRIWRQNWLGSLAGLASREAQSRWVDPRITMPYWTFAEFVSTYDGVVSLGYSDAVARGWLTDEEAACVSEFHARFDRYEAPNGGNDPVAIVNDPEWQSIVSLGEVSIARLGALLADPLERENLLSPPRSLTEGDFTWPN